MTSTKLLLIPCSGEETFELAQEIHSILREDYALEDRVEILSSRRREEIVKGTLKDNRHPLVSDYFCDIEAQVDVGRNELKDVIRGKHIALVEHLLTPNRKAYGNQDPQTVSVNDHIMTIRGFLDIISRAETLQKTLIAPYLTYVRSHSIEKYEARGFYQFDSLRKTLKDYRADGLDSLIVIDAHSEKAAQIAQEIGLDFHNINPFQSGRSINPYKLGLSDNKSKELMKKLRPFQERFSGLKEENPNHIYLVSVDNGTERRTENFTERAYPKLSPEEVYARLVYLDKDRFSYEGSQTRFKPFGRIKESDIDKEGIFIIIDDMYASGGTANTTASILKRLGAKRVEVWTSHPVTTRIQYAQANDRQYMDKVVCLNTAPQSLELNIEYINASAHLLSAELYKTHQKLIALR